jgi:hypothetical protein
VSLKDFGRMNVRFGQKARKKIEYLEVRSSLCIRGVVITFSMKETYQDDFHVVLQSLHIRPPDGLSLIWEEKVHSEDLMQGED